LFVSNVFARPVAINKPRLERQAGGGRLPEKHADASFDELFLDALPRLHEHNHFSFSERLDRQIGGL